MSTYNIISPSIRSFLSDDHLYFEGIKCPVEVYKVNDSGYISHDSIDVLEKYFHDIHNLFLKKLSKFSTSENSTDEENTKMQALLQELVKVKGLIEGRSD